MDVAGAVAALSSPRYPPTNLSRRPLDPSPAHLLPCPRLSKRMGRGLRRHAAWRYVHEDLFDRAVDNVAALPETPTARSTRPRSRTTASLRSTRTGLLHGRRIALHPSLLRRCAVALVNLPGRVAWALRATGSRASSSSPLSSPPPSTAGPRRATGILCGRLVERAAHAEQPACSSAFRIVSARLHPEHPLALRIDQLAALGTAVVPIAVAAAAAHPVAFHSPATGSSPVASWTSSTFGPAATMSLSESATRVGVVSRAAMTTHSLRSLPGHR
jgi:hypothetical protein